MFMSERETVDTDTDLGSPEPPSDYHRAEAASHWPSRAAQVTRASRRQSSAGASRAGRESGHLDREEGDKCLLRTQDTTYLLYAAAVVLSEST